MNFFLLYVYVYVPQCHLMCFLSTKKNFYEYLQKKKKKKKVFSKPLEYFVHTVFVCFRIRITNRHNSELLRFAQNTKRNAIIVF